MAPSRTRTFIPLVMVGASLAIAPAASAQSCEAPPGRAAVEQYCESVPGPGGDRGATAGGKVTRPSAGAQRTRDALARSGGDGQELARFLATAPAPTTDPSDAQDAGSTSAGSAGGDGSANAPGGSGETPDQPASGGGSKGSARSGGSNSVKAAAAEAAAAPGGVVSAVQASSSSGAGVLFGVALLGAVAAVGALLVRRRKLG